MIVYDDLSPLDWQTRLDRSAWPAIARELGRGAQRPTMLQGTPLWLNFLLIAVGVLLVVGAIYDAEMRAISYASRKLGNPKTQRQWIHHIAGRLNPQFPQDSQKPRPNPP